MTELNLLFVHDHYFFRDNVGYVYSSGGLPRTVWYRYLSSFHSIHVLARNKAGTTTSLGLALSSTDNVDFVLVDSISDVKSLLFGNKEVNAIVYECVKKCDAVIARLSSELGLLAIRFAKQLKKPYAIELVDCPWDSYWNYGSFSGKIYAPIYVHRVRKAMKEATQVLYVTQKFLQDKYSCGGVPSIGCSNVEIPAVDENCLKSRIKKIQVGQVKPLRIGMIGSLSGKLKGFDIAFQALHQLKKDGISFEFHILGGGDSKWHEAVATDFGIRENVFFDGVRPAGQAVFDWLDELDLYIHPSKKEGLPRALIEAMSRALPCIASNIAGTPELLTNEYLCPVGNYKILHSVLVRVINNSTEQQQMAINNFEKSKDYQSSVLNARRTLFWSEFANRISEKVNK